MVLNLYNPIAAPKLFGYTPGIRFIFLNHHYNS